MKRAILLAAMAACAFQWTVNPRAGAGDTEAPDSDSLRAIAIEVLILGTQGGNSDQFVAELTGSSERVATRVRELQAEGRAVVIDRIRLTTLEDQKMLVQSGRTAPVATGRSFRGSGQPQTSYQQQSFGTLLSGTAQVDNDAIVVEFQIERSQLERSAENSESDDRFVPPATGSLTAQTTVRIRSGHTIVASGLDETSGGESTAQLILASARLLDAPSKKRATPPRNAAASQVKIFALENASADAAAAVIRELADGESAELKVSVDSRTNSLIVGGKKEQLAVIEAILLRLDTSKTQRVSQKPKNEKQSGFSRAVNKFDKLDKKQLQEELKRLQKEVLVAEQSSQQAAEKASHAAMIHKSASDDEKANALLRMIEANAARHKPSERYQRVRSDMRAAEKAYYRLLVAE